MDLKQIAAQAGVSPSTVSNVLNGRRNVSEETRRRIVALCEAHGIEVAPMRSRATRNKVVLFVFSDFDRGFYPDIFKGVQECLACNGYELVICTEASSERLMKKQFSLGAITLDARVSDAQLMAAAEAKYPVVVMDRLPGAEGVKSVVVDNYPAMCEMVQGLIGKGYRRFGFLSGPQNSPDNGERYAAFLDTLEKNRLRFNRRHHFHGDFREESGYQAARLMQLSNAFPQVLVCANDSMAIGAMRAFRERGIDVPGAVAVTGFDDGEPARAVGLTTVAIPRYESGYLAAQELLALLEGQGGDEDVVKIRAAVSWRTST